MRISGENTGEHYRGMVDPLTADKRGRVIPAYGVRRKVITLDAARVNEPLGLKGDVWYCDYNSTGVGLVQLNNTSEDPLPAIALGGLGNMPFDELFLTNAAQAGLVLNLWYGYGADFISPTSAIATIGSITNAIKIKDSSGDDFMSVGPLTALAASDRYLLSEDGGYYPAVRFSSTVAVALNGTETVFAAAANTNGGIIWDAEWHSQNGTGHARGAFVAKATAPTTLTDGDVILGTTSSTLFTATFNTYGVLRRAVRIPSGVGLFYLQGDVAAAAAQRKVHYSLF